jgi:AbrB family looped-hinge helix DNA binding protein
MSCRRSEREALEFIEQTADTSMEDDFSMTTMVTRKNRVTIPAEVRRKLGIKPGWRLDWQPVEGREEVLVRVIPDRGELARRLLGAGRKLSPDRDADAVLVAERTGEG